MIRCAKNLSDSDPVKSLCFSWQFQPNLPRLNHMDFGAEDKKKAGVIAKTATTAKVNAASGRGSSSPACCSSRKEE